MNSRALRAAVALLCATAIAVLSAEIAHADQIREDQWHLRFLKVTEAHKISQGAGITVAVIDNGVDQHPDLRKNLTTGTDVVLGGAGDGRGDTNGHGTAMAGLIAAHGGDGSNGALGIAPRARIMSVRLFTQTTTGTSTELAAGIKWAVAHGAKVINISNGGGPSRELQVAVEAAIAADVVLVAAAGNSPTNRSISFPAVMDGVVAVGASDAHGKRAAISIAGKQLTLLAPGTDILSTGRNGIYREATGTSGATAIVSGAVALIRSKYPDLSAKEVIHRLTATATDKGAPGRDDEYGYGVLDLVAALTADIPPLDPDAAPSATATATESQPATPGTALPPSDTEPDSNSTAWFVALTALVILGFVITLVVVFTRRRRPLG